MKNRFSPSPALRSSQGRCSILFNSRQTEIHQTPLLTIRKPSKFNEKSPSLHCKKKTLIEMQKRWGFFMFF
jgi:hypothetical protein